MSSRAPRPHTGGHKRVLCRNEVLARRETILRDMAPSAERRKALSKIAGQLRSIDCRTERNGA